MANLNTKCNSQAEAQSLDAAVGQVVQEAIPSTFGPDPCALFQGTSPVLTAFTEVTMSNSKALLVRVWQLF